MARRTDWSRISLRFCSFQEISFDVFLQVVWLDKRIRPVADLGPKHYIELTMDQRNAIWVPDLYIRQLREMKILKVFEEISSLRIFENSTISLSIGATIIIKCDMDFVLYPLDVQSCPVDFSSCKHFNWFIMILSKSLLFSKSDKRFTLIYTKAKSIRLWSKL